MSDETTVVRFSRDDAPGQLPPDDTRVRGDTGVVDEPQRCPGVPRAPAKRTGSRRVPPTVKWVLGAFGVLAAAGFGWQMAPLVGGEEPTHWEVADRALKGAFERHTERLQGELTSTFESAVSASETRLATTLEHATSTFGDETVALTGRLGALEHQLVALTTRMAAHETQLGELRTGAVPPPTDLALIRQEIGRAVRKVDRKWRELSEDVGAPPATSALTAALPFQLVAMDVWDGKPQLAVRDDDRWHFLRIGDQLRGWTVISADYDERSVRFRDPNHHVHSTTLPIGGGPASPPADATPPTPAPARPTLTVLTEPRDATVKVMNIVPKYHDQMALSPGPYDILVQQAGYHAYRRWIRLGRQDRVLHVALTPK